MLRGCALDIGDGACIRIASRSDAALWIDCGSTSGGRYAADRWRNYFRYSRWYPARHATALCLTHFHDDHYNGLLVAAYDSSFPSLPNLRQLLWPRLPAIPEATLLVRALYAFAVTNIGDLNGVMDADLVVAAQTLKGGPIPVQQRLSQGDTVQTDSGVLHAIWPPQQLPSDGIGKIRKAVADFENFIRRPENRKLRQIYEESEELKLPSADLGIDAANSNYLGVRRDKPPRFDGLSKEVACDPELLDINRRLRAAANYCCLAFVLDGPGFLCLSDLKDGALSAAVDYLRRIGQTSFNSVLAPHHGTGWSSNMMKLAAKFTIVTAGKHRGPQQVPGLGRISGSVGSTDAGRPIWFDSKGNQYFF